MKTLVIHPYDESTKFLSLIYEGKEDWTIITENASKRLIFESLKEHDRIIMLGHGLIVDYSKLKNHVVDFNKTKIFHT